jgi:serine/threonine-protein kinase
MIQRNLEIESQGELTGARVGPYVLKEKLGGGGSAAVYRALQEPLGREVAIKVMPATGQPEALARRLRNEASALARLDHANILPLLDFGADAGHSYLVMPLVLGGSMKDLMARGPVPPTTAYRYLKEIAAGLHHAHEAGLVHRDVKPSNVLIHAGSAQLTDFGLVRREEAPSGLTAYRFTLGTPGYMAPEQVMGHAVDRRADVYGLAVIAFELLTGTPPFTGETNIAVAMNSLTQPVPSARSRKPELPAGVDRAIARAMSKAAADRQPTALAFVDELLAAAAPALAVADTVPDPTVKLIPLPVAPLQQASTETRRRVERGPAVSALEEMGIARLRPQREEVLYPYFHNAVCAARHLSGDEWHRVAAAAGIDPELTPPTRSLHQLTVPAGAFARLEEAIDEVFPEDAVEFKRHWGRIAMGSWIGVARHRHRRGRPRGMARLLEDLTAELDSIRGEKLHRFKQLDDDQFWVVHYGNLHATARRSRERSCHYWVSAIESLLRAAGLANDWVVDEIECGCVTGSGDCVFAIRSVAHDDFVVAHPGAGDDRGWWRRLGAALVRLAALS